MIRSAKKNVLQQIVQRTRRDLARRKLHGYRVPGSTWALGRHTAVQAALSRESAALPRIIAEIKFRSPSAGQIQPREAGAVQRIAKSYEQGGAAALSVLTDRQGFDGNALDVRRAACAVSLPILYKGFIVDPLQVELARYLGASMVLLIVRALERTQLHELVQHAKAQGLAALVEAADAEELEIAAQSGAHLIGVNARDLRSFEVDSKLAQHLISKIPKPFISIYMSGIASKTDLQRIADIGADAVLVGELLMRAADPSAELQKLLS